MRGATSTYSCKNCRQPFTARVADRARGWARFCSKSCKAIRQTQRTGRERPTGKAFDCDEDRAFAMSAEELSMGGYGDADWDTPFHEGKF